MRNVYEVLLKNVRALGHLNFISSPSDILSNNREARGLSSTLYRESARWMTVPFSGGNETGEVLMRKIGSEEYVFPQHCKFFNRDVCDIKDHLASIGKFDLILLDPPWWNKYIRRKKAKCKQEG